MKTLMKSLAVAAATAALATIALATPASAKGNDPEVGGTMTFDRSSPACTQLEDAKTAGFYWWKNDPFVQRFMQNHKDNCTWLKAGVEYRVRVRLFAQRLRELGWIEGRNIAIEYRWAEGRSERFGEITAVFVAGLSPATCLSLRGWIGWPGQRATCST